LLSDWTAFKLSSPKDTKREVSSNMPISAPMKLHSISPIGTDILREKVIGSRALRCATRQTRKNALSTRASAGYIPPQPRLGICSKVGAQSPRTLPRTVASASASNPETDMGDGSGGGQSPPPPKQTGGNGNGNGNGGHGDEDDAHKPGDAQEAAAVEKMLRDNGCMQSLPEDLKVALEEGRLTIVDAERWIAITKGPVSKLAQNLPVLRSKMLGNPRLLVTIGIELAIGCTAKMIAEVQSRKKMFWKELDFVFSDMMLEIVADFSLVWLLSPSRMLGKAPTGAFLGAIRSLPGHMFQKGNFTLAQRAATTAYRGAQFFCVGVISTLLGHGSTIALVNMRPKEENQKELSPLIKTSLVWASFMVISSNLRYQTVNGIEDRLLDAMFKGGPRNLATFFLRFGNCYAGGMQWVSFARLTGLQ